MGFWVEAHATVPHIGGTGQTLHGPTYERTGEPRWLMTLDGQRRREEIQDVQDVQEVGL